MYRVYVGWKKGRSETIHNEISEIKEDTI